MSSQQWGALIGGGALAIYGISRRSPLGIALAAGGSTLAVLGSRRNGSSSQPSTTTTLLINCTPYDAYKFWRNFENLPRFMNRLQNVSILDDRRSRWTALGPMGREIQWEAEITEERENEMIAWRSLPGSDFQVDGRVEFREAPAGRGTLVSAQLQYNSIPGAPTGIAKFFSKGANFAIRQDLRRLEAILEAGEIPTIEGQSHGPRDRVTALLRVADPTRPIGPGQTIKDAFTARRSIA
jgi:uncharacterized membrane protein